VKYLRSKNRNAPEVIEANSHQSKTVLKYLSSKIFITLITNKMMFTPAILKIPYTTVVTEKKMLQQNAVHDQQSMMA